MRVHATQHRSKRSKRTDVLDIEEGANVEPEMLWVEPDRLLAATEPFVGMVQDCLDCLNSIESLCGCFGECATVEKKLEEFVATFIVFGIDDETGDLEVLPASRRSAARDVLLERLSDLRGKIAAMRKLTLTGPALTALQHCLAALEVLQQMVSDLSARLADDLGAPPLSATGYIIRSCAGHNGCLNEPEEDALAKCLQEIGFLK